MNISGNYSYIKSQVNSGKVDSNSFALDESVGKLSKKGESKEQKADIIKEINPSAVSKNSSAFSAVVPIIEKNNSVVV